MMYVVYQITNKVNGKIYVGVHQTNDLNDGYMGSGLNIRRAIKKYGIDAFDKTYLAKFDNEREMFEMESQIVNEEFVKRGDTYNILHGGWGSFSHINQMMRQGKSKELRRNAYMQWFDGLPIEKKQARIEHMKRVAKMGWNSITPEERKAIGKRVGKKMGDTYGGYNRLQESEVNHRLNLIRDVDMTKYGWVKQVSEKLNVSHTQAKRFIKRHFK